MADDDNQAQSAVRRIVTGEAGDGSSIVARDDMVEAIEAPLLPGARFFTLWGADAMPALPNAGAEPSYREWFPPPGGAESGRYARAKRAAPCLAQPL
jgi:hypothetical protein